MVIDMNDVPLRELIETRLNNLEQRLVDFDVRNVERHVEQSRAAKLAMEVAEKAINKAEITAAAKAEQQNEWRGAMSDITARLPTRVELAAQFDGVDTKMNAVVSRLDKLEGSGMGKQASWTMLVGAVAMAGVVAGIVAALAGGG